MKKTMYRFVLTVIVSCFLMVSVNLFASETDDRIESSANESYVFKTYLNDDDITVQSKNGIVTLTGTVSEDSHKSLAQETVSSLPEVTSVDNKLEVEGETPNKYSDAWLITKVKSALLFHWNVNAIGTEILVKDGVVTLRGKAASSAQKALTTEHVKDVDGVKSVMNEMTVSTAAKQPDGKTIGQKIDSMGEAIDDASITAMVKSTLLYHNSTSALKTTVKTKDGVVMLGGKAENAAVKDLATEFASDVHGVKSVVNSMTVEKAIDK
ncbi:MAG: BON domain-containing protein [Spirochaetales bacterium]|jgi:hyperosmotically inducible protein|nr:BON domain-containing protein [Spirochaetales bacterium]